METHSSQAQKFQRIIGLTGGIGMGKTTISNYLEKTYHLPVLDADVYAREAVGQDSPILHAIAARYGTGVLLPDGTLNRHRLGDIIFASPPERLWVEQQIHPYVRDRMVQALTTPPLNDVQKNPTVVLVVPLLFEARMTDLVTEIWVVQTTSEHQLERLIKRDRLTLAQAQTRINSQLPTQRKAAQADVVLDNSSTLEDLLRQVDFYWQNPPSPKISSTAASST
jgi:dephospho-CoA kinase